MDLKKIFIKSARPTKVGGQAVLDGIMMKGETKVALVMRLPNKILYGKISKRQGVKSWTKIPIIRGVGIFGGALIEGVKTIMQSADILEKYDGENALEEDKLTRWLNKKLGKEKAWNVLMYFAVVFSLAFSIGIFIILPTALVNVGGLIWDNHIFLNLIEGFVRIILFVIYVLLISKIKEIKDVFRYHGAEHKAIHCFESEKELTVENCKEFTTLHPRCGTSFLVFVLIISLILFSFLGWPNLIIRISSRLLLLPVIAGLSYELLRWAGRSDNWLVKVLSLPGIYLQKITTAEPTNEQLEVAVAALKVVTNESEIIGEGICDENGNLIKNAKTLISLGEKKLKDVGIEERDAKVQSELLYCHVREIEMGQLFNCWDEIITVENAKKYNEYISRKIKGEPIEYIMGYQEFMGLKFQVNKQVLIPRMDTEILIEKVEEEIKKQKKDEGDGKNIEVLDLCCGSGAIGISIGKRNERTNVTLSDVSKGALKVADKNARVNHINVEIIESDLFQKITKKFDIICSNPPYIPTREIETLMKEVKSFEPKLALDGGKDGLDFYRKIIKEGKDFLKLNGTLIMEIGHGQGQEVIMLMKEEAYSNIGIFNDLDGKERVVKGTL